MVSDYLKSLSNFQKIKYGIILLYFILNLILLIISFNMSVDNLKFMIKMGKYSDYVRYFAISTMTLFIVIVVMYQKEIKAMTKKRDIADEEIVLLKSKLYDKGDEKSSE